MTGTRRIAQPRTGASDGTTPLSWKIVTTANCSYSMPFETQPIVIYNETLTAQTATVEGIWGGGSLPLDSEIFLEVEYLSDASSPLATLANDGQADLLATPAAQTASSATWSSDQFATFDGTPSTVTMSNGNKTATRSNTSTAAAGARSTTMYVTGKYYYEVTVGATNGAQDCVAIAPAALSYSMVLGGAGAIVAFTANAPIWVSGVDTGMRLGSNIVAGDVVSCAIDLTAAKIWFRKNGGLWNGNASANPATGVGGASGTAGPPAVGPMICFGGTGSAINNNMTANFGATTYAHTPPAGFSNWILSWSPFKLSVLFTAAQPGWFYARVKCARPSSTFYIDPKVTLAAYVAPPLGPPLDAVASVTGAWSLSRNMLTSFGVGTRYTKSAGTSINALNDQSGNSRAFGNSSTGQPTEVTAFPTSVLCADFDGVDDFMTVTGGGTLANLITASSGAIVVSIIIDAVTQNSGTVYSNAAVFGDIGQFSGLYARNLSGVTFYAYNWGGSADAASVTGTVGVPCVLMWRHHGGNIYISINGGTEVVVASGSTSALGTFNIGGTAGGTSCNYKLAEMFTTSDGSQTTALAAAISNMKTWVGA